MSKATSQGDTVLRTAPTYEAEVSLPRCVSTVTGLASTAMTRAVLRVLHVALPVLRYLRANTALMVVFQQQLSTPLAQHSSSKTISV